MLILILFAFIAGLVTILSPCIFPILPVILGSADPTAGKSKPLGIVAGFIGSFTFFTLFLATIIRATGLPADTLRFASVIIIAGFGITLLIPKFQSLLEVLFSRLSSFMPRNNPQNPSFLGGSLIGFSLGLIWTPCVGPILASVIALAVTGSVSSTALIITLSYSIGTAIPMFIIIYGGGQLLQKHPWLVQNTGNIQKAFGVLMIATAIAIFFNIDRKIQTAFLQTFPNYGTSLTQIEDNTAVQNQILKLKGSSTNQNTIGKPKDTSLNPDLMTAPEIIPGGSWINSDPLTLKSLRGKVVLVDFWTYTCINCQRTLPFIKSWYDKYKDQGFVVIGVHTPEFAFEKDLGNVQQATRDFGLTYPIVQDNDYATWSAYNNHYWPAKYLIDKEGHIRHTHFGEGAYDDTEAMIQKLLKETGATVGQTIDNPDYQLAAQTPETYLGYARLGNLLSPENVVPGQAVDFTTPNDLPSNAFAFSGSWTLQPEFASPSAGSSLSFNFTAKDVYLVMRPTGTGTGTVSVSLDGQPITADSKGRDVSGSQVTIDKDRLYHLVHLAEAANHTLTLTFSPGNIEVFSFTFR